VKSSNFIPKHTYRLRQACATVHASGPQAACHMIWRHCTVQTKSCGKPIADVNSNCNNVRINSCISTWCK